MQVQEAQQPSGSELMVADVDDNKKAVDNGNADAEVAGVDDQKKVVDDRNADSDVAGVDKKKKAVDDGDADSGVDHLVCYKRWTGDLNLFDWPKRIRGRVRFAVQPKLHWHKRSCHGSLILYRGFDDLPPLSGLGHKHGPPDLVKVASGGVAWDLMVAGGMVRVFCVLGFKFGRGSTYMLVVRHETMTICATRGSSQCVVLPDLSNCMKVLLVDLMQNGNPWIFG